MLQVNNIYHGDCNNLIKELDDNSIDIVITDPPYELGSFRGEELKWENKNVAYSNIWNECYRVLKPGGLLFSFGANRTIHKIANKIEESGFDIRDTLIWKYKQSIPRNMNISKSIDATILFGKSTSREMKMVEQEYGGKEYTIQGTNNTMFGEKVTFNRKEYSPVTDTAKEWDGWGTNLAPSFEPIVLARKQLDGSNLAKNLMLHGVGALNVKLLKEELGKFPCNIIEIDKERKEKFNTHPTVKPIKIIEHLLKLSSKEGYTILDPFMGSGTTAVACAKLNRNYIGFEINGKYIEIANKRLKELALN